MRIEELTLFTIKLEAQKQFHKSVFDITILEESTNHFTFQVGWTKLTFHRSETPFVYHYCYLIPSNKLNHAIKWLEEKVELIITDGEVIHPHTHWNAAAIYFYDAAGNIGEFIVRYDLENETDGSFTYNDILCINEIGLPSPNCKQLNKSITDQIGTKIWKGDLERFVVNGDEEGMFLLVNNSVKKNWYPTDVFPEPVKVKAKIKVDNHSHQISYDGQEFKVTL